MTRTLMFVVCFHAASTASHADMLATFDRPLDVGIVSDIPADVLDIDVYYVDKVLLDRIEGSTIFDDLSAVPSDVGKIFAADSSNDANFSRFEELLTNATEEVVWTGGNVTVGPNGEFRGVGILLFEGNADGFAQNPLSLNGIDLWGYDIAEVQLGLNELSLDYDGEQINYTLDVTLSILGQRALQAGDADGNGVVEFADFLIFAQNFNAPGRWVDGDFDLSGRVDFRDFLALSANYVETGPMASAITSIPEPAALTALVGTLLTGICLRSIHRGVTTGVRLGRVKAESPGARIRVHPE